MYLEVLKALPQAVLQILVQYQYLNHTGLKKREYTGLKCT